MTGFRGPGLGRHRVIKPFWAQRTDKQSQAGRWTRRGEIVTIEDYSLCNEIGFIDGDDRLYEFKDILIGDLMPLSPLEQLAEVAE